jgi:WD40 repeat protein
MKKSIFLFALLLVAIFGSNRAIAIELDTVWVSDINGQVLFQHPVTKNILVAANGGITELNSQDGKVVRSFPFIISGNDLSPDGNLILMSGSDTKIFDFNTLEEKYVILKSTNAKFLDNNTVIYRTVGENIIAKYDLKTKEKKEITPPNGGITAVATSPNGKYIAYATYEKNNTTDSRAYLYLLDAETMQGLGEISNWDSQGKQIENISFSPNSKKCRILSYSSSIPITIFDVENYKLLQKYNQDEISNHLFSIDFIDNEHILLRGGFSKKDATTQIQKISNKEVVYDGPIFINQFAFNQLNYNLYCSYEYNRENYIGKTFCFDINKIITGIPQINPFNIRYGNKKLYINCNKKPINQISIMSIEGREIFRQNYEILISNNNQLEIPLFLSNGLYLIKITSGNENFIHKLLIKE